MSKIMKNFTKTAAFALGATMLFAAPAQGQINSVNDLLQKVRTDAAKQASENAAREAEFKARAGEQASKLASARAELAGLERQARSVQNTFDANQDRVTGLKDALKAEQGEFGEVFGLARSKAGEFKSTLENSMINAQYPVRTEVLGRIAESEALPSTDELNTIWKAMLSEIKAQREVAKFDAQIANSKGGEAQSVTRVGPFAVFTSDGGEYLEYQNPETDRDIALTFLGKQPGGAVSKAAKSVAKASAGELVFGPIDPTRGNLLKALERVPDVKERVAQGGPIGLIILSVLLFGSIIGLFRIFQLTMTSSAVNSQKKKAQPSKSNPLGRIMMAYDGVKDRDEEIIELKLDEAILRESPKLERWLNFLKLGAGIAPLLGLLGTVTGMIKTFQAMMIYGAGDPQLMAGGISEALVTTMLGLIAAIPLLILHSFCASLARGVQSTLEEQSAGIVARHVENRRS
jgi:biopolymer transport protein ExbB